MSNLSTNFTNEEMVGLVPHVLFFEDDGTTPNSPFPVLVYELPVRANLDVATAFERLFDRNEWKPLWRDGVFDYHHYHSTAHEVLGVATGHATLRLGGENGSDLEVKAGDVLVLPAGTGHCRREQSDDFLVVGAYPRGQEDYDIQRVDPAVHDRAVKRIARVSTPRIDPVTGQGGSLINTWIVDEHDGA
ncbi:cupin domain-containing protein [Pseudomonas syringae]|uniref:cupin domain-containing protein n=1 Tax=Pseudomonas syringae TaxID=317 RepID=UPI001F3916EB|nr:cupin domain-containing protein [Pseudomonas syringae]MCF5707167.1 cupin domain-containing protein [Pseudomonas syringae]